MFGISLLFVRKLANSGLLAAFPVSISKIPALFSFATVSLKALIMMKSLRKNKAISD